MESFFIKAAQLLLSLSLLVLLHEMGHFFAARFFNTRVEKFYLFFNPWFSLFKIKRGDTEYGIGWLPLGGYVKISGMIDESMDKDQMSKPAEPWEFRSKPAWQRLIIMIGGVTVNFVLAFFIYTMILTAWGDTYLPNKNLTDGVWVTDSLGIDMGFQNGDKIISVDGEEVNRFRDGMLEILFGSGGDATIDRGGEEMVIHIPVDLIGQLSDKKSGPIFFPRIPFIIGAIPDTSHNANAGLEKKDEVVGINGKRLKYYDQFLDDIKNHKGESITLTVKRNGTEKIIPVNVSDKGYIGVVRMNYGFNDMQKTGLYEFDVKTYTFLEAIPAGLFKANSELVKYTRQFKLLFNPGTGAYKAVGGFGAIGNMFPAEWNWHVFWDRTAFLSLMLAFMNLLPIPALDGGHVMFLLYEMVSGKEPGQKFMERAQVFGMVILLSLLVFANGNDLFKAIFG